MTKIFISHSNNDSEFALKLARALNDKGIDAWIDKLDIRAGKIWWNEIQRGLDECDTMILVLSPDAMSSDNVAGEWGYYLEEGKQIFPVRWLPANINFRLRGLQYVDFHQLDFGTKFEVLYNELQKQGFLGSPNQGEIHEIRLSAKAGIRVEAKASLKTLTRVEDILPPPFEWVEIPGGKVVLQDTKAYGGAKGGVFEIPSFKIAKYPITREQYFAFANKSGGDADPIWWNFSEEAEYYGHFYTRPSYVDCPDCPITDVRWFDAIAFCRWLSAKSGLQITLPSERQWQRAAIGDNEWEYPWGNGFDRDRCNTAENGIKRTTSVTQYLLGWSPYGVRDMSGNAWEWCSTIWGSDITDLGHKGKRCSRGGSYFDPAICAKATFRRGNDPYEKADGMGFRVCMPI